MMQEVYYEKVDFNKENRVCKKTVHAVLNTGGYYE